jgi:hypothetical protein
MKMYKANANKKRRALKFEQGDFVWAILTKDRFHVGEYNKLAALKIGPIEVVENINPNAYQLKLPSHIKTCSAPTLLNERRKWKSSIATKYYYLFLNNIRDYKSSGGINFFIFYF